MNTIKEGVKLVAMRRYGVYVLFQARCDGALIYSFPFHRDHWVETINTWLGDDKSSYDIWDCYVQCPTSEDAILLYLGFS